METIKKQLSEKRRVRVRARISGTAERPRISVKRSLRGIFVQLIDDVKGETLASVNSKEIGKKGDVGERKAKIAEAFLAGKLLAEKALKLNIKKAVFDRAGYKYHGRVQAVADGAREGGLEF